MHGIGCYGTSISCMFTDQECTCVQGHIPRSHLHMFHIKSKRARLDQDIHCESLRWNSACQSQTYSTSSDRRGSLLSHGQVTLTTRTFGRSDITNMDWSCPRAGFILSSYVLSILSAPWRCDTPTSLSVHVRWRHRFQAKRASIHSFMIGDRRECLGLGGRAVLL
ncbi:hypothetical protein BD779DRAFT_1497554, partial [Infundibulicybe gibba]